MKTKFLLLVSIIAALLCLEYTPVYAAEKADSYVTCSNSKSTSTKYPTKKQIKKIIGHSAKTIKKFSNGFIFDNYNTSKVDILDKNKKKIGSFNQLHITYKKDKDEVVLIINKEHESEYEDEGTKYTFNDIELRYISAYHAITWNDNSISYSILVSDGNLTEDTLLEMAKDIIK
jgi:hypothetical protein